MKYLAIALALVALPALAEDRSRLVQCKLVVEGRSYIDGECRFTPQDRDGSFQIMSGNGQYFAQLMVDAPGAGTGYWNEEAYANHAHSPLGVLTRQEACWVNERASICAW